MHDPQTVAFDCKIPWGWHTNSKGFKHRRYVHLFTIWHVDPEVGGDDDSCGWTYPHLTSREKARADDLIANEVDNIAHWFRDERTDDKQRQLRRIFRLFKREQRPWWRTPRWHVHHWRLQVPAVQSFKRWAFSRCAGCGDRFAWGYAPTSTAWNSDGPGWFKGEPDTYHRECTPSAGSRERVQ